ncbi:unnamed protein product [Oikopleura dioica]|uniref:Uncharacterized protein n=1 Tax=Oikopleura dioica TaxID=34765 RepID=E4YAW8_OIKDI|nr:unnamed protein product [Oikopleura dioica]
MSDNYCGLQTCLGSLKLQKTKRYAKSSWKINSRFSNTETRDLGLLASKEDKKNKIVPKIEPDRNLLAPPEAEQLYYYILPPKEN